MVYKENSVRVFPQQGANTAHRPEIHQIGRQNQQHEHQCTEQSTHDFGIPPPQQRLDAQQCGRGDP